MNNLEDPTKPTIEQDTISFVEIPTESASGRHHFLDRSMELEDRNDYNNFSEWGLFHFA